MGSSVTRTRLLGMVYESRLMRAISHAAPQAVDIERVETPGLNIALEEAAEGFDRRLIRRLGLGCTPESTAEDLEKLNRELRDNLPRIIGETPENVQFYLIARYLKKVVCDMVFGLGPLQDLLDTPAISEIMVVSPDQVYVERNGRIVLSNRKFLGDEALLGVIERIVAPLGRRVDRSQPLVDARLKDGSRVNAIIPPLALKGPCLTIRRFPLHRITAKDLCDWGTLDRLRAGPAGGGRGRPQEHRRGRRHGRRARRRCSTSSRASSPRTSASSRSRTPPSCSSSRSTWSASRRARPTSRARAPTRSTTWCATRCACDPTASWWASAAAPRPSTCCRP